MLVCRAELPSNYWLLETNLHLKGLSGNNQRQGEGIYIRKGMKMLEIIHIKTYKRKVNNRFVHASYKRVAFALEAFSPHTADFI